MSRRLKKLLEKFKSGKLNTTFKLKLTLKDFLTKDENGITFLEHILRLGANVSYFHQTFFYNSIEAGYIYCKYNKSMELFTYTEESLFTEVDGQLFIKYLMQQKKLNPDMIKAIKNHIEIVDMIDENDFAWLSKEIKNKLITKSIDGTYPIEKYIENDLKFKYLVSQYNNPEIIIELCKKYNKYEYLKFLNESALMYKLNGDYTLFDDLISNGIVPIKLIAIPPDIKFINFLRSNNLYERLKNAGEDCLILEIENKKTLLEDLIDKGVIKKINFTVYNENIIKILYKKNKLDLLIRLDSVLLIKPVRDILNLSSNQTLLEYLLDQRIEVSYNLFGTKVEEVIKILYKKGKFDLICKTLGNGNCFLEIEQGIPLIDKLLEMNCDISFVYLGENDEKLVKKLYDNDRADLLLNANLNILLKKANDEETYLDYVLKSIKSKKIKYDFKRLLMNKELNLVATFYLTLAKHDMIDYISRLDEETLLKNYNGKTLLDELLIQNSKLTLEKILSNSIKSNLKIATVLKSKGIEQRDIEVPLKSKNFEKEYLYEYKLQLGIGPLPKEGTLLLKKLESLFLEDGKSDKDLVEALISGYRYALFVDYDLTVKELETLIKIKETNKDKLIYLKSEKNSQFKKITGAVYINNGIIKTVLHETGHALHFYLTHFEIPENYESIVKNIREDKDVLKKVENFSNKFSNLRLKIEELVNKKYESFFENYYTPEKIKEIEEFVQKSKIEKKEEFKSLGISEDILDLILNDIFTKEEYIVQQKRIFIEENIEAIFRTEYGSLMAIADILDAIYDGELHCGALENDEGEKIKRTSGHGIIYYYNRPERGFCEMIANFSTISKTEEAREMLELLKDIIGEELYNMLNNFYYDKFLRTRKEQKKM